LWSGRCGPGIRGGGKRDSRCDTFHSTRHLLILFIVNFVVSRFKHGIIYNLEKLHIPFTIKKQVQDLVFVCIDIRNSPSWWWCSRGRTRTIRLSTRTSIRRK
jgi:hypothetical protein